MSDSNRVLVDSSVWIDFFRGEPTRMLDRLIAEDLVITNDLILTELLPVLKRGKHIGAIDALLALPVVELEIDWELIREAQTENLANGINKVGIPDLIILQQVIDKKLHLHTFDKHFKLMAEIFNYSMV